MQILAQQCKCEKIKGVPNKANGVMKDVFTCKMVLGHLIHDQIFLWRAQAQKHYKSIIFAKGSIFNGFLNCHSLL